MSKMFEVNGWTRWVEKDDFGNGCDGNTSVICGDDRFSSETIEGLIKKIMDFCGCSDRDSVILDALDYDGRVDIQIYETIDGTVATASDIDAWKKGEKELYLSDYSFLIEEVIRNAVNLKAA